MSAPLNDLSLTGHDYLNVVNFYNRHKQFHTSPPILMVGAIFILLMIYVYTSQGTRKNHCYFYIFYINSVIEVNVL